MKVTLLGTGTSGGVPLIGCRCSVCLSDDPRDKRLRSAAVIRTDDGRHLALDCGPDFRQQMLREGLDDLDAILFTHEHKDHTGGLDDIRAINFLQKKPVDLYASLRVQAALQRQYDYIFEGPIYPGLPQIRMHTLEENKAITVFGVDVLPITVFHYRLPVLGFRIKNFAYITDANDVRKETIAQLQGLDVLIVNALRKEKHVSHFNLEEALEFAAELKSKQTFFTHISHQMGRHADVERELPDGVSLGYDGLSFYI